MFHVSITRTRVKYRLLLEAQQVTLVVDDVPTYRTVVVSGRAEIHDDDASLLALSRLLRALHEEQLGVVAITRSMCSRALAASCHAEIDSPGAPWRLPYDSPWRRRYGMTPSRELTVAAVGRS